jgi:acyl-CoA reductase-like NAD-dependent aldehyde dehydrogenase
MSYQIINPATEEAMEVIEHLSVEQTDEAIARAKVAQKKWAAIAPADRAKALRDFAAAVDGDIENLAALEVRNSGHPISQARWEANHVRNVLEYYSASPERLLGKQIPVAGGIDITFNEPLGVVGVITPWNFPMTIASWGFAPALAAGNAVVLKPAEWTPLTSIRLGELALQAGLPDGLPIPPMQLLLEQGEEVESWPLQEGDPGLCLMQPHLVARQHAETLATSFRGLILSGDIRFQAMTIGDGIFYSTLAIIGALTVRAYIRMWS